MKDYCLRPGARVKLEDWDPDDHQGDKQDAEQELTGLTEQFAGLQERLFAEHTHNLLIVLQAMDTGGKDGTIHHVFQGVNPQGVRVVSFKVPTPYERAHDFLWREHMQAPADGEIVIFNRSYYEAVLVERVHNLAPRTVWQERYDEIVHFEEMLSNEGTTIVKFYLNISKDEQKKRLQERLDNPDKWWKFNPDDLKERALWDDYMRAYEDALSKTSTKAAPWHIIPANHKWYRNLVVSRIIVSTLQGLDLKYPEPSFDPKQIKIK